MSVEQHSPWRACPQPDGTWMVLTGGGQASNSLGDDGIRIIGMKRSTVIAAGLTQEHAALIVRCTNNFPAMLDFIKEIVEASKGYSAWTGISNRALQYGSQLIAAATGPEGEP